jgi:cell division transport system permease protein
MSVSEQKPAPSERPKRPMIATRKHGPIVPSSNVQGNALLAIITTTPSPTHPTLGNVSMVRATAAN